MNSSALKTLMLAFVGGWGCTLGHPSPNLHQRQQRLALDLQQWGAGSADLDGDSYDDLIILDQSRVLHTLYQALNGTFTDFNLGNVSGSSQWGMCVGDFYNDGQQGRVQRRVVRRGAFDAHHRAGSGEFAELGERFDVHAGLQHGRH